jgi:pyruvate formate lyase activating enzyme
MSRETTGIIFDLQRASLHDGPGLRTTVFLKGCPLRCAWCHNPESQRRTIEVGRSGKTYGREVTVAEVMTPILADRHFYEQSGGGVTLSGGEPSVQIDFCRALLRACRDEGIHTCLDTCGHIPRDRLVSLMPLVDLFHYDIKLTTPATHLEWTGVDGELIRGNLRFLSEHGCAVQLRCPILPGVNDTPEHAAAIERLATAYGCVGVDRLPYHDIGRAKYVDLGLPFREFPPATMT